MSKRATPGLDSFAAVHTEIVEQWHPTKNGDLSPDEALPFSNRKVWWRDEFGHEWEATYANRSSGRKCPYCTNRLVLTGFNDLATFLPELADQWHPTKNGELIAGHVLPGSHKIAWWVCGTGHEWSAVIKSRALAGNGCPYCSGRLPIAGVSDLATVEPEIADELHPTKNGKLAAKELLPLSNKKVWWRCSLGHAWENTVSHRAGPQRQGCPTCSNRTVLRGSNDLAIQRPDVAAEWHPTRNGDLTPAEIVTGSTRKAWWQCAQGHEWSAKVANRTSSNSTGCPYCTGRLVLKGFNDLETLNPDVAAEWHPTRNGDIRSDQVIAGSHRSVWWRCSLGHEWKVPIGNRTGAGLTGCPTCSNRRLLVGFNDLASREPEIAAQWHPIRNADLTPADLVVGSPRKVWWQDELGHEWRTSVVKRTGAERQGCATCANSGFDLADDGWLYLLIDESRDLLQIGITNVPSQRLATHRHGGWRLLELRGPMDGRVTRQWEQDILAALKRHDAVRPVDAGLEKFDGHTEAWVKSSFPVESIRQLLELVHSDESDQS